MYQKGFIFKIINSDLSSGKYDVIRTRFSPEPNGYLHIGHAKSICINFGIAQHYRGTCNLRFDDTNPDKENIEYIKSIQRDILWLGFKWNEKVRYSSDYFEKLYEYAIYLIKKGLAYVDQLSLDKIRTYRGTLTIPGINSPYRDRSVEENLILFNKMRNGEFQEGKACLRAKIDMRSQFIVLRDPVLYRIKFINHHQTSNKWCIYPTYDFAHCISDALEGITHSLCTMEFQDNRRLYNWILDSIDIKHHPKQYEFSRLNLKHTIMSKRQLHFLVKNKIVEGWDDPRMPTISGLRRRGYTPSSIREFCRRIGVTRQDSKIEMSMLEFCIRKELNYYAPRVMAVVNPIRVIIETLPKCYEQNVVISNHPNRTEMGTREVKFSQEIFIDKFDFCEGLNTEHRKLSIGSKVRLRHFCVITVDRVKRNSNGEIDIIFCHHDPNTLVGSKYSSTNIKYNIIHWVSAIYGVSAEFRLYDKLFIKDISKIEEILSAINPNSLIIKNGFVEPSVLKYENNYSTFQFEREGYFCFDDRNSKKSYPVFNRIVSLRGSIIRS